MYNINFTITGKITLRHFTESEQQKVLSVLNKVVSEFEGQTIDTPQLRCLKNDYYQFIVDDDIRVMTKLQGYTFKVIDVFENSSLEKFIMT